jgi:hypothetical protein
MEKTVNIEATKNGKPAPAGIRYVDMEPRIPVRFEFTADGQFIRATQAHIGGADDMSAVLCRKQLDDMQRIAQKRIRVVSAYYAAWSHPPKVNQFSVNVDDLKIRGGGYAR